MLRAMNLYIARHGQTDWNIDDRFQGSNDIPLNAVGREQALALAASVPRDIEQMVVSTQLRARQTAEPVIAALGVPVVYRDAFRERGFGVWEGHTHAQVRAFDAELYDGGGLFSFDRAPQQAETMPEFVRRTGDGLRAIARDYAGKTVLVIAHGFVIRTLRYQLEGLLPAEFRMIPKPINGELLHFAPEAVERWLRKPA